MGSNDYNGDSGTCSSGLVAQTAAIGSSSAQRYVRFRSLLGGDRALSFRV